jgi:uncharacterized protein YfaS (alpha-2-macroglobulin family)
MTPTMKKLLNASTIIVIVLVGVYVYKTFSSTSSPSYFVDDAYGVYVESYRSGMLPSNTTLRIVLTQDVVEAAEVGQRVHEKLFNIKPSVSGKTVWVDERTVEFIPDKRLRSGQVYNVEFNLGKVMSVPSAMKFFAYNISIFNQNYEWSIENVKSYSAADLKKQRIEGKLFTADFAEDASVEKMISANQQGKTLKVIWTHQANGVSHEFTIEDVDRNNQASEVEISVNGSSIQVDKKFSERIEIPALGDFKLVRTKVIQSPSQYVVLQFSDPIKDKQQLQGLITMDGVASLDFDIHDNEIWVFPPARQVGEKLITISSGIRNALDTKLKNTTTTEVLFEQVSPAVRFTGKGNILPSSDGMVLPFEAVNLNAVNVTVEKIYAKNILQFLQVNSFDGQQEMYRVGKRVINKTIPLDQSGVQDLRKWNRFTLDLSTLFKEEPGAIYSVTINFTKAQSLYQCDSNDADEHGEESAIGEYDEYDGYYYYDDYDWEQRDNPCHNTYYAYGRSIHKNILSSDLGLIAKRGDDGVTSIFVTDIKSTQPIQGVGVELFDYQMQLLGSGTTGADGKFEVKTKDEPFVAVATNGSQKGYIKLQYGETLSFSNFNVSGEYVNKGLKGLLYGDRGVWRPGDSLYLTFILEDKHKTLPSGHPVVFEMQNPRGQVVNRIVRSASENGFYNFATATHEDAPTGNWTGRVKVGGTEFVQNLKIETVKPNRLKIDLDFKTDKITSQVVDGTLNVNWLHGAVGKNLKAQFDVVISRANTTFSKYEQYTFEDPARDFYTETKNIFDGKTDEQGKAHVVANLKTSYAAPGFLQAVFRGKVFEESGNFSSDRFSIPYSPYSSYIGMKVPEGEKNTGILYLDSAHTIQLAVLNADGKEVPRQNVQISLYKLQWRWWWDNSSDYIANYVEGSSRNLVKTEKINLPNGKGSWTFSLKSNEHNYGRYFVRACDPVSGHCSGQIIYIDEPGWYSRARNDREKGGADILSFTTDKDTYNIGEKATVTIPGQSYGRALVSIENGSKVLQTAWVEIKEGDTQYQFDIRPEMTPNVYVNISLIQPHAQSVNDLPIRLYGVVPISIQDPKTHLTPIISMPDVVEPGQEVKIKISEMDKRKMTYTIAVVDEGLLDITKFKTPDPWKRFYAHEALGVRTWDIYDYVMGAFGSNLERILAIGGDGEMAKEEDAKVNRFKPVVKFFGPFTTSGGIKEHSFIMPEYVGAVRTMVVAGYEGAYGKAEKSMKVKKPLMVLATLPRVLGPEEQVKLPVTLFTQDINQVKVDVNVKGPLQVTGQRTRTVSISKAGDITIDFDLQVGSQIGSAIVEVVASSGQYQAKDVIEIEIRNPNVPTTNVIDGVIESGKTWDVVANPIGLSGTNSATIEVSNVPPINLDSRLRYLIQYPHGCVEQITSGVFPQLYLSQIQTLTDVQQKNVQENVTAGIEKLKSFVHPDGGFMYWPGSSERADIWGSSYAGNFLVEAERLGYYVPADIIKKWKKFQRTKAQEWRRSKEYSSSDLMQAYRLYTLAVAGEPEMGAMNRLRELEDLPTTAAWMLAAAYAKAGQPEAAKKIIAALPTQVSFYRELSNSYGSDVRDRAIILETLVLIGEKEKAFEVLKEISKVLSNNNYWLSTQETAFSLKAVSMFAGVNKQGALKFDYTVNGKTTSANSQLAVSRVALPSPDDKNQRITIKNTSEGNLYVRLVQTGTPARGEEEAANKNLALDVRYVTTKGQALDVSTLAQGVEFVAEVTVTHTGMITSYDNLALTQIFPSGWEITNLRLTDDEDAVKNSGYAYQDIRDDRVYTYFSLSPNERKTYRVLLTASYAGTFYLPAINCEAMYDASIYARTTGSVVKVTKSEK